jgi:cobalt/nickel transport system ATP-binding protein
MNGLSISDLCFSYPQNLVLDELTLQIDTGERVGVIGPNGAGKTTLFHSICGVIRPNSGTISLFDQPIIPGRFHPDIGLVFQYPDDQLFSPTVWDDIAFGPLNMGLPYDEVEKRVQDAMALTNIGDLADRPPHHLSGGQKRMVAIAGIQAMTPRLIIYDEPSANLDMRSRRRLIQFIQASEEIVLVASHDLELVLEVCERVILLDQGKIVADGAPIDIMSDDALMETHGLERPHSLRPHIHTHGEIDLHDHA